LRRRRGEFVEREAFKWVLRDVAARLDSKFRSLPTRWGPELLGFEATADGLGRIVSKLDEVVEELRTELRTLGPDIG
jgi:hypothetical protein